MWTLIDFVRESNRIEGILRDPTEEEVEAHENFLRLKRIIVPDLEKFVSVIQPGAVLRRKRYMGVRVGNHIAPPGGFDIESSLQGILDSVGIDKAYYTHLKYETLHPFTDGNGRSGRVLWLWRMGGIMLAPLGFLHHFYYQTLNTLNNKGD